MRPLSDEFLLHRTQCTSTLETHAWSAICCFRLAEGSRGREEVEASGDDRIGSQDCCIVSQFATFFFNSIFFNSPQHRRHSLWPLYSDLEA
jgi:hypothetical protein